MIETCARPVRTWRQVAEEIVNESDQEKVQVLMEELFKLLENRAKRTVQPILGKEHATLEESA